MEAASRRFAQLQESHEGEASEVPWFAQLHETLTEEVATQNGALYVVNVDFDWKTHNPMEGVTMVIDKNSRNLKLQKGTKPSEGVAWGHLADNLDTTGWMELYVQATESTRVSSDVKMYAAGWLEGLITASRISQFYSNTHQLLMKDEGNAHALQNIRNMFYDELEYLKKNCNLHGGSNSIEPPDPYWKHARYVLLQMWGIKDGYNFAALAKGVHMLDLVDLLVINSNGEMPELMEAYTPEAVKRRRAFQGQAIIREPSFLQDDGHHRLRGGQAKTPPLAPGGEKKKKKKLESSNMTAQQADRDWESRLAKHGHCSALVRIGPENTDLFVGHTTWNDYGKMTRLFKYYQFNLPDAFTAASVVGMSSYPGCVSSTDDFYILNSGLVVMDTSLEILNPEIYDRVTEFPANSHVPNFLHVMVANRMATTANHWTTLFDERNSGTDNAQWMVIDYNRFIPGQPLKDNTLWVLEKVPGIIHKEDMSQHMVGNGFWASYNRPYFPDIRRMAGHEAAENHYGALYSYDHAPRAEIFGRLGNAIQNLFDMRNVMNRNDYPNEGILPNEPGHAISARMDLDAVNQLPNGGIDAKVVNRCLLRSLQCQAISGPSHQSQEPFAWRSASGEELFKGWPHLGLPDRWDFNWVQMTPSRALPKPIDIPKC